MKKKRFKFEVALTLYELNAIPFVNGFVFSKLKLKSGGSFAVESKRCSVSDHRVRWDQTFAFECQMTAPASGGTLNPCPCRVSLRKEMKGGKSVEKMGYVDVNLAQYAGAGQQTSRFLLKGYSESQRQDNSILKLGVSLTLRKGDPCFKAPSLSSTDAIENASRCHPPPPGHSRSSSAGSSFVTGHSRQSSWASSASMHNSRPNSEIHSRSPSDDMASDGTTVFAGPSLLVPPQIPKKMTASSTDQGKQIDRSRLSAVSVVEKMFSGDYGEKITTEKSASLNELKLYLTHDGSATVAGNDLSLSCAYTAVTLPK